ncbi:hypothetical protein L596_009293 [Steinernema carpocapsae]|uniref:DNA-directed RNA polymerase III subunit n=1 Tax=Steinernema carpocapsae TaxID=34508 RepID=A0A4U5PEX9_STECR|nr:hypothetical protein L596_009293 [Steinernema carpocapsae]
MSRGGKHATQAQTGVRAIANALGIARHEIGAFTKVKKEAPQLYPLYNGTIYPPQTERDDFEFLEEIHEQIRTRFTELETFDSDAPKKCVRHFTDEYKKKKLAQVPVDFQFDRMPQELNFKSRPAGPRTKKRKTITEEGVAKKLASLEARERQNVDVKVEDESDDEEEAVARPDDEEQPMSDDDYLEEDNDYIQNYFDNGEEYGLSDDNLDGDDGC